jgi:hypothetical protein
MAAFVPDSALTTTCILRTFPIQPPIMNSAAAAFLESFGTTNISVEAAALIRKLTEDRQTLMSLMNKDPGDMNAVYKYAEQYLQNLSQLLESLNCCGSVRLQKMLALSWRGAQGLIDEAHRIPSTVQQEIIYEIIMIIYVLGLAKYATAVNLLHSNGAPISKEALKEAAKCFLDAAGIFQYLVEDTVRKIV